MESTTKYSVESYQIAVPGGDCSIHLLLSNPPEAQAAYWKDLSKDEQKQSAYIRKIAHLDTKGVTIKKAVLVDGGYDGKEGTFKGVKACESIEKAIKDIETRYNIQPPGILKFDAWVVTHWDRDHFCGTLQLIVKDLADKFAIDPTLKEKENDPNRHQFRHFKYSDEGECLTTLYSPVFDRTPYIAQYKKDHNILPTDAMPKADEAKIPKGRHWRLQRNETSHNLEVAMIKASAKQIFIGLTNRPKATRIWLKGICKVVEGFENLWGIDVFSDLDKDNNHIRISKGAPKNVKNIKNVMEQLEKEGKTAPVFLLVGAEGYIIGEEKDMKNLLKPSGETLENFISIVSLIIWPPSPENKVGRVSYFNGGDTDGKTETKLTNWMGETPVTVYKTSHHGAYTATPPVVLKKLKPKKVLISAGCEFGHPSWVVLTALFAYWDSMVKDDRISEKDDSEGLVFPMRYPYYLQGRRFKKDKAIELSKVDLNVSLKVSWAENFDILKETKNNVDLKSEILGKPYGKDSKTFRHMNVWDARQFCKRVNLKELKKSEFIQKQPWRDFKIEEENTEAFLLITVLAEYWSYISRVDTEWGQKQQSNPNPREAMFVWTRSYDDANLDGRVEIIDKWSRFVEARGSEIELYWGIAKANQHINTNLSGVQNTTAIIANPEQKSITQLDFDDGEDDGLGGHDPDFMFTDKDWIEGEETYFQADRVIEVKIEENVKTEGDMKMEVPVKKEEGEEEQENEMFDEDECINVQGEQQQTTQQTTQQTPRQTPRQISAQHQRANELALLTARLAVLDNSIAATYLQIQSNKLDMILLQNMMPFHSNTTNRVNYYQ